MSHGVCIFATWQVIQVVPFKLEVYLTARGEEVSLYERYWDWLPGIALILILMGGGCGAGGGNGGIGKGCCIYHG